jgi:uncharacterized SAM-binding protein YcdF (DUF218 family)
MRVLKVLGVLLLLAIAYVAFIVVQIWRMSHVDQYHYADAIVVLGAAQYNGKPSPVLEARLKHALYLYENKISPIIITTGGKAPGDNFTEGGSGATYLEQNGVPSSAILSETKGRDTVESMVNVSGIAQQHGIHTIVMVSDPLHSERLKTIASALGFDQSYTSPDSYLDLHRSQTTKLAELGHEVGAMLYFQFYQRWRL